MVQGKDGARILFEFPAIAVASPRFSAPERADADRVYELNERLLQQIGLHSVLHEVTATAADQLETNKGYLQMFDEQANALEMMAGVGFRQDFYDDFRYVLPTTVSVCAASWRSGARRIVEDIAAEPQFASLVPAASAHGFRAVQSTPLFDRDGELMGMISTHFDRPHRPTDAQPRLLDMYLQHASRIIEIERSRADRGHQEAILDEIEDAVVRADTHGTITYWNEAAADLYGYAAYEALGRNLELLIPLVAPEPGRGAPALTRHDVREVARLARDKHPVWIDERVTHQWNESGAIVGHIHVQRDVRERKDVDEAVKRQSAPLLRVADRVVLAPLVGILDVDRARLLRARLFREITESHTLVLLIDVTGLALIDEPARRYLDRTAAIAWVMGAHVILTGVSPALASAPTNGRSELGESHAAPDLKSGLDLAMRIVGAG